jgi:fructokinase
LPERGVDVSGVQRTPAPTRDVYVVRQPSGDREFAGFGQPSDAYCDTRLDAGRLPLEAIEVGCRCPARRGRGRRRRGGLLLV